MTDNTDGCLTVTVLQRTTELQLASTVSYRSNYDFYWSLKPNSSRCRRRVECRVRRFYFRAIIIKFRLWWRFIEVSGLRILPTSVRRGISSHHMFFAPSRGLLCSRVTIFDDACEVCLGVTSDHGSWRIGHSKGTHYHIWQCLCSGQRPTASRAPGFCRYLTWGW
jgi:hypothetical protein